MPNEFEKDLDGKVYGHINDTEWICICGASGTESTEYSANLELYRHRLMSHKDDANA